MVAEQTFIPFTKEEIYTGIGEKLMKLFEDAGGEHYITDKGSLYDQDFLHQKADGAKLYKLYPLAIEDVWVEQTNPAFAFRAPLSTGITTNGLRNLLIRVLLKVSFTRAMGAERLASSNCSEIPSIPLNQVADAGLSSSMKSKTARSGAETN